VSASPSFAISMDVLGDILFFMIFVIVPWMRRRKRIKAEEAMEPAEDRAAPPEPTPAERIREALSSGGGLGAVGEALRDSLKAKIREHAPDELLPEASLGADQAAHLRAQWEGLEERMSALHIPPHDLVLAECVNRMRTHLEGARTTLMEGIRDGLSRSHATLLALVREELERVGALERVAAGRHRGGHWRQMARGDRLFGGWFAPLTLSDGPWRPWMFLSVASDVPQGAIDLLAEIDVMAVPIPEAMDAPDAWVLAVRDVLGSLVLRSERGSRALHDLVRQLAPGNVEVMPPGAAGSIHVSDLDNLVHAWAPVLLLDQLAGWLAGPALLEAWVHGGMPGAEADRIDVAFWGGRIHSLPPEHIRVYALAEGFAHRGREAFSRHMTGTWMEHHGAPANLRLVLDEDRSAGIPMEYFRERVGEFVRLIQFAPIAVIGGRAMGEEGAWEAVGFDAEEPAHGKITRGRDLPMGEPLGFAVALHAWRRRELSTHAFWRAIDGHFEAPSEAPERASSVSPVSPVSPAPVGVTSDWGAGWVMNAVLGPPPGIRGRSWRHRSRVFVRVP